MSDAKPISAIPIATTRRLLINDPNQMPFDYSSTPGGTIYSTTPGGTRIIYERGFLLNLRNSPLAKSLPKNLPEIPGVTTKRGSPSGLATSLPRRLSHPNPNGRAHSPSSANSPSIIVEEPAVLDSTQATAKMETETVNNNHNNTPGHVKQEADQAMEEDQFSIEM